MQLRPHASARQHDCLCRGVLSAPAEPDSAACKIIAGFIEGKYEPVGANEVVPAGTEVLTADEVAAKTAST